MADDWQMEAVAEQFEVFESLKVPHRSIDPNDLQELLKVVQDVIRQHWRAKLDKRSSRGISAEIIKNSPSDKKINCSFAVIVTNQRINNRLYKLPIFAIQLLDKCIYIDMNCSVYKTWDAFLKSNDLPACKLCYPLNGKYEVGKKLKIDFGASPVSLQIPRRTFFFTCGILASGAVLACSFFFKIPSFAYSIGRELISFADKFLSKNQTTMFELLLSAAKLVNGFRHGNILLHEFIHQMWILLKKNNIILNRDGCILWEEVKTCLKDAYDSVTNCVLYICKEASDLLKYLFFSKTSLIDSEVRDLESDIESKLNDLRENRQTQDFVDREENATQLEPGKQTSENSKIFDNCINECALQIRMKNKSDDYDNISDSKTLHPHTQDLLVVSAKLGNCILDKNLTRMQDILESVNIVGREEYTDKIDTYIKMVKAAKVASKDALDVDKFNSTLGIHGDPKTHYWNETIQSIQHKYRLGFQIKMLIEEFKRNKKIFLVPIWRKAEYDITGLYKITGIQRAGKFSADDLLKEIQENYMHFDEKDMVINEIESMIVIRSENITITAQQELDEENTSLGVVFIDKQSD